MLSIEFQPGRLTKSHYSADQNQAPFDPA